LGKFVPGRWVAKDSESLSATTERPLRSDILYFDRHNITATKLAVDHQIEHGNVAGPAFDLEFRPD
jgi:hypothetical protein